MSAWNDYEVAQVCPLEQTVLFWVPTERAVDPCVLSVVTVMETPVPDLCALSYVGLLSGTVDVIQENDNGVICTIISPGNCLCISPMITLHAIIDQFINKCLKN